MQPVVAPLRSLALCHVHNPCTGVNLIVVEKESREQASFHHPKSVKTQGMKLTEQMEQDKEKKR